MQIVRIDGASIRACREHAGLSQVEVGKEAGFNHVTVSRVERGEITAPETVQAVHEALVALLSRRITSDRRLLTDRGVALATA